MSADPEAGTLAHGWVDPVLAAEFPGLGLRHLTVAARPARSPRAVRDRLRALSNRYTGAKAIELRRQPIPWAYRVFFRQVGIDPDEQRTPPEQAALDRMFHGGLRSRNLLDDALLIAVVETGVGLTALDAARVEGALGLRLAAAGERLGGEPGGRPLSSGQVVLADERRALGVVFGDLAERRGVHPDTERITLAAVVVPGLPEVAVEEAFWTAAETLRAGA